jgi:Asp-tRNA(Asn)/Glu-tRNA(Gln) amidotransferase A subunit family amidase
MSPIKTPYDPLFHQRRTFFDAVPRFLDGSDSPAAYLERCIATINEREPVVQAWQAMRIDAAYAEAVQATNRYRAGKPLSLIDGMPVGIKDLIQTFDLPTGEGIDGNENAQSHMDSASVQALRAAGAVIVGKLVTTELGGGNPSKTTNPFDPSRTPGGSSSGSGAAIGAAMLPVAIGTQVGGSIIRPAGYCANFANKPTFGALHRGERQSSSQSCVGVHAGSLQDLWTVTHEIGRRTGGDPGHPGLFGPAAPPPATSPGRLLIMECTGWRVTDEKTRRAFNDITQQLRNRGVTVLRRGDHPYIDAFEESLEQTNSIVGAILAYENRWYIENLVRRLAKLAPSTLEAFDRSRSLTVDDYREALALRRTAQERFSKLAPLADALISLTAPSPAPLLNTPIAASGQPIHVATGDPVYNLPISMLLAPVVALPLLAVEGMPVGIQLIGQQHDDYRITSYAQWMMENIRPVSIL